MTASSTATVAVNAIASGSTAFRFAVLTRPVQRASALRSSCASQGSSPAPCSPAGTPAAPRAVHPPCWRWFRVFRSSGYPRGSPASRSVAVTHRAGSRALAASSRGLLGASEAGWRCRAVDVPGSVRRDAVLDAAVHRRTRDASRANLRVLRWPSRWLVPSSRRRSDIPSSRGIRPATGHLRERALQRIPSASPRAACSHSASRWTGASLSECPCVDAGRSRCRDGRRGESGVRTLDPCEIPSCGRDDRDGRPRTSRCDHTTYRLFAKATAPARMPRGHRGWPVDRAATSAGRYFVTWPPVGGDTIRPWRASASCPRTCSPARS
jgi:hypothetical protein